MPSAPVHASSSSTDELDRRFVWHPCTQMKDHEVQPPIEITRAHGPFLHAADGRRLIDGVSSWWVNLLGHTHPRLTQAMQAQVAEMEHVIFAGFTHEYGARLAAALCRLVPGAPCKVFYADCGSAAVEVALKMSFQYWRQSGKPGKQRFVSIGGAYHGETLGALSVSGIELYREVFAPLMLDTFNVPGPTCYRCPYELTRDTCAAECFGPLEAVLAEQGDEIAAVFIEPMVQCANGMNMYSPVYLSRLREVCDAADVHLVADEIAVGFGRTGQWFGCQHADIAPDFMCISKGLTGGYLPFSAVTVRSPDVFDAFYGPYEEFKAFYHSHSYTGNPMACRLALEVIAELEEHVLAELPSKIERLGHILERFKALPHTGETRQCGFIGAVEFVQDPATKQAFPVSERVGWHIYRAALQRGAFLRPLGDVLYFMAPLTIEDNVLDELGAIALAAARDVLAQ